MTMSDEALRSARVVFDYHHLHHRPATADLMLVLGTNDTRVAHYAAELYRQGFAPRLIVTGGVAHQGDLLATGWKESEAEVFAGILREEGVPESAMSLETRATNTAENIRFSRQIAEAAGLDPARVLVVCKPFMPRRVLATYVVEWPEVPAAVCSWKTTFDDYCSTPELAPAKIANIMLGDLQRLWIYAERGYCAPQRIPNAVMEAFHRLVELGYDRHLIRETPSR